eukprot:gene5371-10738_t
MAVVFTLLCLLTGQYLNPNYYQHEYESQSVATILPNMKSVQYRYFLVSQMSMSYLLIANAIIEILADFRNILSSKGVFINLAILFNLLLSSSANFFISIPNDDYLLVSNLEISSLVFISGTVYSYAYRYGNSIWRSPVLIIITVIGGIGCVLQVVFTAQYDDNSRTSQNIYIIAITCQLIGSTMILYLIRWYWILAKAYKTRQITDGEIHSTVYLTLTALIIILFWITSILFHCPPTHSARRKSNKQQELEGSGPIECMDIARKVGVTLKIRIIDEGDDFIN